MAYNPPIGSIYRLYHLYPTYILPSGGLYATYHLLREPFQQPLRYGEYWTRSPAKKIRSSSDRAEVADDNDWELRFEWKREGTWIPGIPRSMGRSR